MGNFIDKLKDEINSILPKVKRIRRELHQIPEIALQEYKTSEKIRSYLRQSSLKFRQPLLETDIIVDLTVADTEEKICFRADIDALPLNEETGLPHCSKHDGFMHACGHDGHSAILIGTALVLERMKAWLTRNVRFIFQPGEEMLAGGAELVARGALNGVNEVFALHGFPGREAGKIHSRAGILLAAAHVFKIKILGKGGHGATPHLAQNPVPAASEISLRLKELHAEISRADSAVVTVCSVSAGRSATVIPDEAVLQGTARYLERKTGEKIEHEIRKIVSEVCEKENLKYEIDYDKKYYLPVKNDSRSFLRLQHCVAEYFDNSDFKELESPLMWAEDFAFYLNERPGCLFLLGLGEDCQPLHSARFDFNDEAIFNGILLFCVLALNKTQV